MATAALALGLAAWAQGHAPPPAPSQPVTDVLHGQSVSDPYRNLEDLAHPETQAWLHAQGQYTAAQLARIDGHEALLQRIGALAKSTGDAVYGIQRMPGGRVYFMQRQPGESQFKLMLHNERDGSDRVLVDVAPLARDSGVPYAINFYKPSWDGRTLAYGVSAGGSENASLHLMDVATGVPLISPIPRVLDGLVNWAPDSRSLTYNQTRELPAGAPESETFKDSTVYWLPLGRAADPPATSASDPPAPSTPSAQAAGPPQPLFGPTLYPRLGLDRLDVAGVMFAPGSRYMVARTTDTTVPEGRLFVAPLAALGRRLPGEIEWQPIATAADRITDVQLQSDTLYLRTTQGAPRGRLLALPLADPVLAHATEVLAEPASGVLQGFSVRREGIAHELMQGFNTRTLLQPWPSKSASDRRATLDLAPSLAGSTLLIDEPAAVGAEVWLATSTWTDPPRVMSVKLPMLVPAIGRSPRAEGPDASPSPPRDTGLRNSRRPPGVPEVQVTEVQVPSHDGAPVPLAILHRRGLKLDGSHPTLLIGYGAYGLNMEARFDPRSLAWLERGGVLAYANVRGSGAFGEAWHRAGFKATKPNTWKDGLACARYLVAQGYARPATLGIWGTSAGGIFVGRAVTTAPELFAAAIFEVGMMDTVRYEESANGATNVSEFGTVKKPDEFAALLEMSTYHHIRDGVQYPGVLLAHGLNDPRVDVWHSAKAGARLQAANAKNVGARPVLLRLDGQAGHGMGSTAQQGEMLRADIYSFLLWQFGQMKQRP